MHLSMAAPPKTGGGPSIARADKRDTADMLLNCAVDGIVPVHADVLEDYGFTKIDYLGLKDCGSYSIQVLTDQEKLIFLFRELWLLGLRSEDLHNGLMKGTLVRNFKAMLISSETKGRYPNYLEWFEMNEAKFKVLWSERESRSTHRTTIVS